LKYRGVKVLRVESLSPLVARPRRSRPRVDACPEQDCSGSSKKPTVFVYILVMLATGLVLDSAMLPLRRRL